MAIKVNEQYLQSFIGSHEKEYMLPYIEVAHDLLHAKKGAGNDFLGWLDLPLNYDKEEYDRIKIAAKKIAEQSSVLIVICIPSELVNDMLFSFSAFCPTIPKLSDKSLFSTFIQS